MNHNRASYRVGRVSGSLFQPQFAQPRPKMVRKPNPDCPSIFICIPDSRSKGEGRGFCRLRTCQATANPIPIMGTVGISFFRLYSYYSNVIKLIGASPGGAAIIGVFRELECTLGVGDWCISAITITKDRSWHVQCLQGNIAFESIASCLEFQVGHQNAKVYSCKVIVVLINMIPPALLSCIYEPPVCCCTPPDHLQTLFSRILASSCGNLFQSHKCP